MRSGRRKAGRKISRNEPSSRARVSLISRIPVAAASALSARVRTVRASSSRPFLTSQRGLSGTPQEQEEEEDRGDGAHGVHPAPVRGAGSGEDPVDEVGQEDAGDDGQLVDRDEGAADAGRRDLGDVERREDGRRADAQAADEPEDDEFRDRPRQGAADGRDEEEDGRDEHEPPPPDPVADGAGQAGPEHAADEDDAHGPALLERVERELLLHVARRAGDDGRVEAEDQAADGGDEGDGEDVAAPAFFMR